MPDSSPPSLATQNSSPKSPGERGGWSLNLREKMRKKKHMREVDGFLVDLWSPTELRIEKNKDARNRAPAASVFSKILFSPKGVTTKNDVFIVNFWPFPGFFSIILSVTFACFYNPCCPCILGNPAKLPQNSMLPQFVSMIIWRHHPRISESS